MRTLRNNSKYNILSHWGKWLCTMDNQKVLADKQTAKYWEQFTVIDNGDNTISFRSHQGKYLTAEKNYSVTARADVIGPWEKWTYKDNGDKTISFRSYHGRYLCAEKDFSVKADREKIGAWEKWWMEDAKLWDYPTLKITSIECVSIASGIHRPAALISGILSSLGGGGAATAGLVSAAYSSGGTAVAVVGAGITAVGLGTLIADSIDKATGSPDQFYMTVNGNKIYPADKKYIEFKNGQKRENLNIRIPNWKQTDVLELWEWDRASGDDSLGSVKLNLPLPHLSERTAITINKWTEGSIYVLTVDSVEPSKEEKLMQERLIEAQKLGKKVFKDAMSIFMKSVKDK